MKGFFTDNFCFVVSAKDRKRLCFLTVFLSLLFCLLIARFYQIQIVEKEKWEAAALAQHQYVIKEPCMRGAFFSNTSIKKGHPKERCPFVVDVPKFHLYIDPDSIPKAFKEKMFQELCPLLPEARKKKRDFFLKSRSRKIACWLDREQREEIEIWWKRFYPPRKIVKNALYFSSEFQRAYPFGSMLGAVLHTIGEDDAKPTGGLELLLDRYLRGREGKRLMVRTGRRPFDTGRVIQKAENGADVYLTINHYLQAVAEAELKEGVSQAEAKNAWAVMMDVYTGEVLALAQYPPFDPSHYNRYFNDPLLTERTKVKAITDSFEPGSIFKAITAAICLKANEELEKRGRASLFHPEEKIPCSNGWFPGRRRPLKDARVYPYLNLDMAMQKSSNIYFATLAERLIQNFGDAWYRKNLEEIFGFGKRTGIDIPAESAGLLPTPGKMHPNGALEWSTLTPYSLALGHNILCNSIQIARSYAILANGGFMVQPHLIRKVERGGKTLIDNTSYRAHKQVLSSSVCDRVKKAMRFVTKPGGTSKQGDILGYTEIGKSGTAEKVINGAYSKELNISSFVGVAPAEKPRFVLIVSVDEPARKLIPGVGRNQFGGVCAAPIFRRIASKALQYLGVAPDDPYGYGARDPRSDPSKAKWALETEELRRLFNEWNR